jgi:ABC-type spermidine/putrescine transport system permease subunit I
MKPENIIDEAPKIAKDIERVSKVRSKKKADVLSLRYRKLRGRVFRISMFTATIPIILMLLIMVYSIALFGEFGLIVPSNCSLPPPIDVEINVSGGARCYTYIIWVVFFVYLMVMPLYNRISGVDLLRSLGEKR